MAWSEAAREAAHLARGHKLKLKRAGLRVPKGFTKGAQAKADAAGWGAMRRALLRLAKKEK